MGSGFAPRAGPGPAAAPSWRESGAVVKKGVGLVVSQDQRARHDRAMTAP